MSWISIEDQLPESQKRVLVRFVNEYNKEWFTFAEYIAPRTVLEEDFGDEQYSDGGEYDEEKNCYWATSGWYEYNYEPDVNWKLEQRVTHWTEVNFDKYQ